MIDRQHKRSTYASAKRQFQSLHLINLQQHARVASDAEDKDQTSEPPA